MNQLTTIIFALCALLPGTAAWAAESNEGDRKIEEIVVTATFRETNLMDTPSGISAMSEEMMQEMGAESMADLFQHVAGLNMTTEEVGASRYAVRGISSQVGGSQQKNTFSSIGVYFDNTPVTSALGPQGQTNGATFDLNRVEVLKGPQGTLFGEGSQGGSIRYIFNQPNLDEFTAAVNLSGSRMAESDDTSHRADVVVNIPIVDDVLALRVLGFDTEAAGYVDLTTGTMQKDYNPSGAQGGRVSIKYQPMDNALVSASYYISDAESEGLPLVFEPYRARTPIYEGLETRSNDRVKIIDLTAEIDLGWANLTSSTSILDREAGSTTGSPAATLGFLDSFLVFSLNGQITLGNWPALPTPTGSASYDGMNIIAGGFKLETWTERVVQEFRLVSPTDQRLRWTAGLFYKSSEDRINLAIPVVANPGRPYLQEPFDLIFDSPTNKYSNELSEIAVVTYQLL